MTKKASLFAIFYILFLDNFGFAVIIPLFPSLFLRPESGFLFHGESAAWRNFLLGFVLAAFPLGQFFGAPFFGDLADRFGRKKIFYCTILGTTIGYFLSALEVHHRHISGIFISRLITGFFAGNLALCMATVADLNSDEKQRGKYMGFVATFLGLSWIFAIIIGANFADPKHLERFNPALPFIIIGFLSLTSVFVLAKFFIETHPTVKEIPIDPFKGIRNIAQTLDSKKLRVLYLFIFFWLLGFFLTMQWAAPVSIERYRSTQTGIMWVFALQGVVWTISSSWINSYLIRKYPIWNITIWTLFGVFIFFLAAAIAPQFSLFSGAFILSGGFSAIGWSNNMNLISTNAAVGEQGKAMGIGQSVTAFIQILTPLLGAGLAAYSSLLIFYMAAVCVLLGLLIFYGIYSKQRSGL